MWILILETTWFQIKVSGIEQCIDSEDGAQTLKILHKCPNFLKIWSN